MNESAGPLLLADLGGTNARFALATTRGPGFSELLELRCADFPAFDLALDFFLEQKGVKTVAGACIAAAGPVVDQKIRLTNNHWQVDAKLLSHRFGGVPVRLMNDFAAAAWSVPWLSKDELLPIASPKRSELPARGYTCCIIGAGTGLGVAGLVCQDGKLQALTGEGGHVGFAPENPRQLLVWHALHDRGDRVTIESLVSGPGLENIFWALGKASASSAGPGKNMSPTASRIFSMAQSGDPIAAESVAMFFAVLGQAAGDFVLAMGAFDGVYIAGGIARRYPQLLSSSRFRQAFENKGPYRELMQTVPSYLVLHPQPGLLGASYCARMEVGGT